MPLSLYLKSPLPAGKCFYQFLDRHISPQNFSWGCFHCTPHFTHTERNNLCFLQNLSKSVQTKFCLAQRLGGVRIKTQQKLHLQAVKMSISSVFFSKRKGMSIISVDLQGTLVNYNPGYNSCSMSEPQQGKMDEK